MLEHGGNLALAAKQYGIAIETWLDLSTGINPNHYPIPSIPTEAWQRLPDNGDGLIDAACAYYRCRALLPTAGSQAALQALPKLREHCHIALPNQMYQEHAHAWLQHGHQVSFFRDEPDTNLLNQIDVLLVCNPNNPTGKLFAKADLLQWHQQLSKRGGWLIIDEAFMDTSPDNSIADQTYLEGLFVLRSIGKFFGLAGTRVGFLLAQNQYLNQVQETLGPWTIAGASRHITKLALQDTQWQQSTLKNLMADRDKLKTLLTTHQLPPNGGTSLFQFVMHPQAVEIHQLLAKQGIWLRLFKEAKALRFGLPPASEWRKLEAALAGLSSLNLNGKPTI
jgi:cobalamin biosynthetic protein CobC